MQGDRFRGLRSSRIWLARGALGLVLLAVCGRPSAGQGGTPERTPPAPAAENPWVSEEQAVATAERFARAVGLPWDDGRPCATFQAGAPGSHAMWTIRSVSNGETVAESVVDAVGNYVSDVHNSVHTARQTKKVKLSPEEALARATRVIELMGVERRLIALCRLELTWDPGPGGQHWRVDWECVLDGDRVGGSATVLLNAESGALLQARRRWWPDGPIEVRISRQKAARLASEIGCEVLGVQQVELAGPPGLCRVSPNDSFGPSGREMPRSSAVQMAWSATVSPRAEWRGGCTVWIDPVDGHLLGGRRHPWGMPAGGVQHSVGPNAPGWGMPAGGVQRSVGPNVPGWGMPAGGVQRSVGPNVPARSAAGRAKAAGRYLVGAIAGMAAVVIIVLVVVWPRHGGVSRSDR